MSYGHNRHWVPRLVWYACGAVILLLLPLLKYSQLWGSLPRGQKVALLVVLASFGGACLLSLLLDRVGSWADAVRSLERSWAVLGLVLIAAMLLAIEMPRYLLVPLVALTVIVVPLAVSPVAFTRIPVAAFAVLTAALGIYSTARVDASSKAERVTRDVYLTTAFYPLHVTFREGWIPEPATRGGGLHQLDERVLLATGDGHLYVIDRPAEREGFKIEQLPTRVPLNREEFAAAFGGSARSPKRSVEWSERGPPKVQTWRFRVADTLAVVEGDHVRILASHHYWKAEQECFIVRVSELSASLHNLAQSVAQAQWSTLFDSSPCIPLKGPQRKRGKNPFKGEEVGGRMQLLEDHKLLLTLGDQAFSGVDSLQAFSQDPAADYGKTVLIDLNSREHRIFTSGHRNPQGLYRTRDGRLWLTEHGPQGGDELNLLQEAGNYGWPVVTYGTDYGMTNWPLNKTPGRHAGFRQPVLSWVPSIGASALIGLNGKLFPNWGEDLLVGSLSTRSLYRLVVVDDRVVVQEPIAFGKRVRDLLQTPDGHILVWSDDASIAVIEPSSARDGAGLFASHCGGCHAVVDGATHRLGPDLSGVVGRSVATASGFDEYSPAMKAQAGAWDEARLDRFLARPQEQVPGTSMGFPGMADAGQRRAIIEYLQRATAPKAEEQT